MNDRYVWKSWQSRTKLPFTAALIMAGLLPAGYASAQALFTEVTGTAILVGPPVVGTITCPGGEPTGELMPWPCQPETSRVHLRNWKFPYFMLTNDPRLWGTEEVTANGNFEGWRPELLGPASGQMWGTAVIRVREGNPPTWTETGEVWEEVWTGTRTVTSDQPKSVITAVAHGSGGRIEGLQAQWTVTIDLLTNTTVVQGRILNPGGKMPQ